MGRKCSPSEKTRKEASRPVRHSSSRTLSPASPKTRRRIIRSTVASACCRSRAITTPFPAASPSALTTSGKPRSPRRIEAVASSRELQTTQAAVGTRCRFMKSLAKILLPSRRAAAAPGPTTGSPWDRKRSTMPSTRGSSGPTTVRSMERSRANWVNPARSSTASGTFSAMEAVPPFPGAQKTLSTREERQIFQASACSRPPDPMTRTFIALPPCRHRGEPIPSRVRRVVVTDAGAEPH